MSQSGYDFEKALTLMKGRLGIYDQYKTYTPSDLEGVQGQNSRLQHLGGSQQQDRMIRDKRRSLDRALWSSYQGADIINIKDETQEKIRALINPNKLKPDYDDKVLSVGYEFNFQPGDIFEWLGTGTKWIIYLQDLTELSYFRGDIRRCSYEIKWKDGDEIHSTFAAVRGPVETKINYIQKHKISIDRPNYSLNIIMPKNEETLAYFKRYSKFYLQDDQVCWRIEAIDWISTPGILEINAVEYYANEDEDNIEEGIAGGLIVEPQDPNPPIEDIGIEGKTFIKALTTNDYHFTGLEASTWKIDGKYPVDITVDKEDGRKVKVKWTATYSGQFDLYYGENYKKTIVVESLF